MGARPWQRNPCSHDVAGPAIDARISTEAAPDEQTDGGIHPAHQSLITDVFGPRLRHSTIHPNTTRRITRSGVDNTRAECLTWNIRVSDSALTRTVTFEASLINPPSRPGKRPCGLITSADLDINVLVELFDGWLDALLSDWP